MTKLSLKIRLSKNQKNQIQDVAASLRTTMTHLVENVLDSRLLDTSPYDLSEEKIPKSEMVDLDIRLYPLLWLDLTNSAKKCGVDRSKFSRILIEQYLNDKKNFAFCPNKDCGKAVIILELITARGICHLTCGGCGQDAAWSDEKDRFLE